MDATSSSLIRDGSPQPAPEPLQLKAGPVTALFQPDTAYLRYLRLGDHELVRAIYGAVRDQHWNTITPILADLQVETKPDSFIVTFTATCRRQDIHYTWRGTITGQQDGSIRYQFDGQANSAFLRNRIGLCVLHPILECAGKEVTITKTNGAAEHGKFPNHISPHQPFKNIRSLAHEPAPGTRVRLDFEGDTFEMEDQRNWTDASFKTYSTPLEQPLPAQVNPGDVVRQSVTLSFPQKARKILPVVQGREAQISISTTPVLPRPAIGFRLPSSLMELRDQPADLLRLLNLQHLRVDVLFHQDDWAEKLQAAISLARTISCNLHVALFLSDEPEQELAAFTDRLSSEKSPLPVSLWLIYPATRPVTPSPLVDQARPHLSALQSKALFAAGSKVFFAELNRNRPPRDSTALPCYSINPQVHSFDNLSLIENIGAQAATVETVQQFLPKSVVVSPITLRPFTHNARGDLLQAADSRQASLFAAGWTLGSISNLASSSNLHSLTYYDTTGANGILPAPGGFTAATAHPLFHVFADLADAARLYPSHSSHPLDVSSLTLVLPDQRRRVLVANHLPKDQSARIKSGPCHARIRYLDETTASLATGDPSQFRGHWSEEKDAEGAKVQVHLKPYAVACVELG